MKSGQKTEFTPRDRWLILSFVGGPSAWFLHLNISNALVPESCDRGTKILLHVTTIVCVLLAAAAAAVAWRIRAECAAEPDTVLWKERTKWTADFALWVCVSMIVVIIAQHIPNVLLGSCQ
jgi:hypothetical protein